MSRLFERYTSPPPIVIGEDRLPHCGWCLNEFVLCNYHRARVRTALNASASATTLMRAESDIRYIIRAGIRSHEAEDVA